MAFWATLELAPVELEQLVRGCANVIAEKVAAGGIEILIQTDALPQNLIADERRLRQVLFNLLSNTVKFTPAGGRITLAAQTVQDQGGQAAVQISVSDTGIGIEPADLQRIFNPFEQLDSPENRKHAGTGLGLSQCWNLAQLHGGRGCLEGGHLPLGPAVAVAIDSVLSRR